MRCALFGRSRKLAEFVDQILDGAFKHCSTSLSRPGQRSGVTQAAGQRTEPGLREDGHLLGRIGQGADDEVLQRLGVVRVDDLGIDRDGR